MYVPTRFRLIELEAEKLDPVSKCLFTNFTNLINVINELILIRERFLVVQGIPEFLGIGITAVVDLDRFDLG